MVGTFEGLTTLQFTPDNKHAFVYSGSIQATSEITAFEFQTLSYYLVGKIQFTTDAGTSNDLANRVYINNNQVSGTSYADTRQNENINQPILVIVPPFTTLKATGENVTSGSNLQFHAIGTFQVLGSIEQLDLEVKEWAIKYIT